MKLRSILNKVTPQKFRVLMEEILELMKEVKTVERLKAIVHLIFEKVCTLSSIVLSIIRIKNLSREFSCAHSTASSSGLHTESHHFL